MSELLGREEPWRAFDARRFDGLERQANEADGFAVGPTRGSGDFVGNRSASARAHVANSEEEPSTTASSEIRWAAVVVQPAENLYPGRFDQCFGGRRNFTLSRLPRRHIEMALRSFLI